MKSRMTVFILWNKLLLYAAILAALVIISLNVFLIYLLF